VTDQQTNATSHRLQLQDVRLSLRGTLLLALDADVCGGEIVTVMGPSGAGKSSLLAWLAGFLAPAFSASGTVLLDGRNVLALPAEQRRIGLLFQDPLLFPHLSVGGNLRFALPAGKQDKDARVQAALFAVGLEGYAARDPDTLSGGQKSRVALQRLLLSEPHAVLLDEPFSRLDASLRREVRALVFSTLQRAGLPTLMVTHDPEDAEAAGGRIVSL
jgi:putative thiamine transport system ATP-binding protein